MKRQGRVSSIPNPTLPTMTDRRRFIASGLDRYFASALGFAVAAIWTTAGFVAALVCVLASAASYASVAVLQRGALDRLRPAEPKHRRSRELRVARGGGDLERPRHPPRRSRATSALGPVLDYDEPGRAATSEYGW
jgi:hypothetical protein